MKDTAQMRRSITSNTELSRRALLKSGAGAGLGLAGFQRASRGQVTAAQAGEKTISMGMWQPIPTLNTLMTAETGNVVSGRGSCCAGCSPLTRRPTLSAIWRLRCPPWRTVGSPAMARASPSSCGRVSPGTTASRSPQRT